MRSDSGVSQGISRMQQAASGHLATRNRKNIKLQISLAILGLIISFAFLLFFHKDQSLNNVFRLFAQGLFEIIFVSLAGYIIYQSYEIRKINRTPALDPTVSRSTFSELSIALRQDLPNTASSTLDVSRSAALSHRPRHRCIAAPAVP